MIDKERIKTTIEKILQMEYGSTILHDDMAHMLGVKYRTSDYNTAVTQVAKKCLENGKPLKNIQKIGYTLPHPDEHSELASEKFIAGARRIKLGGKVLRFAPKELMTSDALTRHRSIEDKYTIAESFMNETRNELKRLGKKKYPFSIPAHVPEVQSGAPHLLDDPVLSHN